MNSTPLEAVLAQARAFVAEWGQDLVLASGEPVAAHAEGTLRILDGLQLDEPTRVAACLFPVAVLHSRAEEAMAAQFSPEVATLVRDVRKLLQIGVKASGARYEFSQAGQEQIETLRKLLLAFAQDIRVVLIRLASRLQTLRWYAQSKRQPPNGMAREVLDLYAPLANRLGIWQLKWELEDLAFRFDDPDTYKRIAQLLDEKRIEREGFIAETCAALQKGLAEAGVQAEISGRPKHIYSIWKKMRGKTLDFSGLYDVRAFRVIVEDVAQCYTALGVVHHLWMPVPDEFDDYIAKPKPNGYQSLHTIVQDGQGKPFEVQIRTQAMHHFAEYGVAAHWRYKEAGAKGYGGQVTAAGRYDEKIAWLRQLLAWKDEASEVNTQRDANWAQLKQTTLDDHIYVLTPQARVLALAQGSTPIDFAYALHTDLGHRCRGAKIEGALVPLNTPLQNGQTVEIVTVKQGGPSRDWLNPELKFLASHRAKAKVRAWFNALELQESIATGRVMVEKTLQREGKTSVNLDDLAQKLGFKTPEDLFWVVAKDEFSLRNIENLLREKSKEAEVDEEIAADQEAARFTRESRANSVARGARSGVLVVGMDSLLTQLSRCCKPAPPDDICGFVTRGKGVSIHRAECTTFARLAKNAPERVIETEWGQAAGTLYPVDIAIEAVDRQGLLRDISETFARDKLNVIGVKTQSSKGIARMRFTVEVEDAKTLKRVLAWLGEVRGVLAAKRQ